ncbi:MAG: thioredoxin TrxC [Gammaproteobacteria bacterium]|nr:thioredoxin TrxC [Gammaproteobacteria bacterium]
MTIAACPNCSTLNRLPADKNAIHGKCGHCKSPLFVGVPIELTKKNFDAHVIKSELPIVIDFWADWCGPCKMMAPIFSQAVVQLEPMVRMAKLDTEKEGELASKYAIRSIPTLIMFKKGKEIDRVSGALQSNQLIQWVQQTLK